MPQLPSQLQMDGAQVPPMSREPTLHAVPSDLGALSVEELRVLNDNHHATALDIQRALRSAETRAAYAEGKSMTINCKVRIRRAP